MADLVYFRVDSRLASILGETYSSVERALKELVDNAWDADSTRVEIVIPEPPSTDPIVVADNGSGMTAAELENEYLVVARDRRNRRGTRTQRGRPVKGRKGIGKFAGLMVAQRMQLSATTRGETASFTLEKPQLMSSQSDLEKLPIEVVLGPAPVEHSGTRI